MEDFGKDGDTEAFLSMLNLIAKAKSGGITALAQKTGMNRAQLYRTLSNKGNPTIKTLQSILNCLGYHLTIKPIAA